MPTQRIIQTSPSQSQTAAKMALDNATSPDTFIGAGEVALQVVERIAVARLRNAARALRGEKTRAAPTEPGGGECCRHL